MNPLRYQITYSDRNDLKISIYFVPKLEKQLAKFFISYHIKLFFLFSDSVLGNKMDDFNLHLKICKELFHGIKRLGLNVFYQQY